MKLIFESISINTTESMYLYDMKKIVESITCSNEQYCTIEILESDNGGGGIKERITKLFAKIREFLKTIFSKFRDSIMKFIKKSKSYEAKPKTEIKTGSIREQIMNGDLKEYILEGAGWDISPYIDFRTVMPTPWFYEPGGTSVRGKNVDSSAVYSLDAFEETYNETKDNTRDVEEYIKNIYHALINSQDSELYKNIENEDDLMKAVHTINMRKRKIKIDRAFYDKYEENIVSLNKTYKSMVKELESACPGEPRSVAKCREIIECGERLMKRHDLTSDQLSFIGMIGNIARRISVIETAGYSYFAKDLARFKNEIEKVTA